MNSDFITISGYNRPNGWISGSSPKMTDRQAQRKVETVLIKKIRTRLLDHEQCTIAAWARKHGYSPKHVRMCIYRYTAKQGTPQSPLVYAILTELYESTDINLMEKVDINTLRTAV